MGLFEYSAIVLKISRAARRGLGASSTASRYATKLKFASHDAKTGAALNICSDG
jgi:hypothetical protein